MPLQVDADDPASLRQCFDIGTEHFDRSEPAMDQYQRLALPIGLVPDLDAIDVGMTGFDRLGQLWHGRGLLGWNGARRDQGKACRDNGGR
ncbi:hypothetical protein D3C87_1833730 [compost metagenome]